MLDLRRGVLAVALVGAAAFGLAIPPASAQRPFSWTGFYIGANAGAAWGDSELGTSVPCGFVASGATPCPAGSGYFSPANQALTNSNGHGTASDTSFIGGIQVGYNVQSGGLVYGLEADVDWMRLRMAHSLHQLFANSTTHGEDIADEASADYLITVRPRIGFTSGSALFYATGGLAITTLHQSHSYTQFGFGPAGTCFPTGFNYCNDPANASDLKAGWTVGGGIEWALNRKWSIKGEYLFTQFPSATTESTLVHGDANAQNQLLVHDADLTVQTVRAGINYKLN